METVHDRIRYLMNEAGLNQTEFAKRIGIKGSSLSVMLKGETSPSPQTASLICKEFGVTKEWLLEGVGEMRPASSVAEAISTFLGNVLHDKDDFKLKLISALANLNESDWNTLRKISQYISNSAEAEK